MTRIFEALRKTQGRAPALPFPAVDPAAPRPAVVPKPAAPTAAVAAPALPAEAPGPFPRIESVPSLPLDDDVVREMTALRIGLESALEGETTRVVLFMSAVSGEGVSTVATEFASLLASDTRGRSLLLDLHARRAVTVPRPARARPRRAGRRGPRPPAVEPTGTARGGHPLGLAVMGDTMQSQGACSPTTLRAFLASVSTRFDWVVVDCPPALQAPESINLAPLATGVVLVVRSGFAKRPVVVRAVELLRKSGVRLLGCVLNRRRYEIPDFIYRRI